MSKSILNASRAQISEMLGKSDWAHLFTSKHIWDRLFKLSAIKTRTLERLCSLIDNEVFLLDFSSHPAAGWDLTNILKRTIEVSNSFPFAALDSAAPANNANNARRTNSNSQAEVQQYGGDNSNSQASASQCKPVHWWHVRMLKKLESEVCCFNLTNGSFSI